MINKKDIFIILIIGLLTVNIFKKPVITQQGYTQKELDYLLEIQKLKIERSNILTKVRSNERAISKDSAIVWSADIKERDSLRAILNPR